ncbi:MAG: hypothetical protein LBQ12_14960 [Deltaproteobacteria bacterium]|jgi:hypothetical protein|nr:hypothetical protein [Deltaproteobacteria bacterium]
MGKSAAGSFAPILEARSRVGTRLTRYHSERLKLDDARKVYGMMARLTVTPHSEAVRARAAAMMVAVAAVAVAAVAAVAVVPRHSVAGRFEAALAALLGLRSLPKVPEVREALAVTGSILVSRLETQPDRAAQFTRGMGDAGASPELKGDPAAMGTGGTRTSFRTSWPVALETFHRDVLRHVEWSL